MVPIAEAEARHIAELLEELPEPRRTLIRRRFAEAGLRLAETGLLEKLERRESWTDAERQPIGLEYFHQGIACPFLEDEACSIHADRPLACREYLVTSPAENCARPTKESVHCVPMPLQVSATFRSCESGGTKGQPPRWVPLILALEWAKAHSDEPSPRSGQEFVETLLARLTGKSLSVKT
jgi:Fe-S-cluster containining protein